MNKLMALISYQFKLQTRDFMNLFFIIAFPMIMYIFFSNLLEGEVYYEGTLKAIDFLLPAYIPLIISNTVVLIFGQMLANHVEFNFFIKYKLLGYKPVQVAGSLFLSVLLFQAVGIATLILTAVVSKGVSIPLGNMFNIVLVLSIINILQFAIAFFLSSVFSKSTSYQSVAMIVFYFQMFLGGMTLPPEMFPARILLIAEVFNPIIHGVYALRGVWIQGHSVLQYPMQLLIVLGASIVLIAIGSKFFKWSELQS
ncbi:ABC transporter permease [Alkalicella caledoniensis]|uniref:ABC transporter permease n=1 Tax=Alkalicella caledoniensis TaxID=2731377 RepID=A0A7G9W472_ALKCA|nr:ABC transporter permease [Alkalicella caledoniensis]QNO13484.1 ABC transporter permease [Alkalicella caledoniensis]